MDLSSRHGSGSRKRVQPAQAVSALAVLETATSSQLEDYLSAVLPILQGQGVFTLFGAFPTLHGFHCALRVILRRRREMKVKKGCFDKRGIPVHVFESRDQR